MKWNEMKWHDIKYFMFQSAWKSWKWQLSKKNNSPNAKKNPHFQCYPYSTALPCSLHTSKLPILTCPLPRVTYFPFHPFSNIQKCHPHICHNPNDITLPAYSRHFITISQTLSNLLSKLLCLQDYLLSPKSLAISKIICPFPHHSHFLLWVG